MEGSDGGEGVGEDGEGDRVVDELEEAPGSGGGEEIGEDGGAGKGEVDHGDGYMGRGRGRDERWFGLVEE